MILDTSALMAIIKGEPEALEFAKMIQDHPTPCLISAASYVELSAVVENHEAMGKRVLDTFMKTLNAQIEPVTVAQAEIAREAYRDFGRTSQSPAKLNFGDCFSYALAKEKDLPLLFKGNDFMHTDVLVAFEV